MADLTVKEVEAFCLELAPEFSWYAAHPYDADSMLLVCAKKAWSHHFEMPMLDLTLVSVKTVALGLCLLHDRWSFDNSD